MPLDELLLSCDALVLTPVAPEIQLDTSGGRLCRPFALVGGHRCSTALGLSPLVGGPEPLALAGSPWQRPSVMEAP